MVPCDRLLAFDPQAKVIRAEAGISLDALLRFLLPRGFIVPVMPGTRFVTLGGMIANDVHGKNHHRNGTFGKWVRAMELRRSDGATLLLTPDQNPDLFAATIGGLGLTGTIAWAEIAVLPLGSNRLEVERLPFHSLADFFRIAEESSDSWEFTVAWVDCLARETSLGRGLFSRARLGLASDGPVRFPHGPTVPADLPAGLLNKHGLRLFNDLYFTAGRLGRQAYRQELIPFFFPLDAIGQWNRCYGRAGFYQYQCVVPTESAEGAVHELLDTISKSGQGSFLAVLKTFGDVTSPGMLSFPKAGTTLALDFPNRDRDTMALFERLDAIVKAARGRLYPAKDGRMSASMFKSGYPEADRFASFVDPRFSSTFWRRVSA